MTLGWLQARSKNWRNMEPPSQPTGEDMIRQRLYEAALMANTFGLSLDCIAADLDQELRLRKLITHKEGA